MSTSAPAFTQRLGLVIGLGCTALGVLAAPAFRAEKNYPDLGLRLRVLGNSIPEPLPQSKTFTYTFTRGDESTRHNLFDPQELWFATQHAGQWRDEAGNVLMLGRPTHQRPAVASVVQAGHVSREAFERALADPANRFDPASAEALATWIAAFTGCTPGAPEPLRLTFNLTHALFFPVDAPATLVYAFRVKSHKPNAQSLPSDWFCAVIKIADGTLKSKVRKDFEVQFLANVAATSQTGAVAAMGVQPKVLLPAPAAVKGDPAIPEHPSRTAARKSIANMKDWWLAETPDYVFLSNIRSAVGKSLVKELQTTLPALRGAFAALIPPFDSDTDVSVVRIFEEPDAYKLYVGKEFEWSNGVWSPLRRELVILSQGRDSEKTLAIIKHEGFHQYLFYATRMIENAVWFNEGHACFFETAIADSKARIELPENARVNHLLANLDAAAAQLPTLIHAGHDAFYNGAAPQRALNYTTSWALVYFLRKGAPATRLTAYAGILDTYLKTLAATRDAEAATTAAFAGIDMAKLQDDFTGFWKKGRSSARRYDPFAAPEKAK